MDSITETVCTYQKLLLERFQGDFAKHLKFGVKGVPNLIFMIHLSFMDRKEVVNFVQQIGLIQKERTCKCGQPMMLVDSNEIPDGFVWQCYGVHNGQKCDSCKNLRANSWFYKSNLQIDEILLLTYDLVSYLSSDSCIKGKYSFDLDTIAHWRSSVQQVLVDYTETNSIKIGGSKKQIEVFEALVDEKDRNGQPIPTNGLCQWTFAGIECSTGKFFFVEVPDESNESLISIIKKWIYPGTTIVSNCWKTYHRFGAEVCNQLPIDNSITFKILHPNDDDDDDLEYSIESSWHFKKATLPENSQGRESLKAFLAKYIFIESCEYGKVSSFLKFTDILSMKNWPDEEE